MKILLTGCQGQVGQAVIKTAKTLKNFINLQIIPCDKKKLDITHINSIQENIKNYQPDIIINTAAYTAVDQAELADQQKTAFLINAQGVENLAKICAEKKIKLIHLSTDYVFDGEKKSAYLETDKPNPVSIYGQSKLQGEQAVLKHCQDFIILRVSWVFSEYGHNSLKNMLKLMTEREELNIVSDQTACPTYAGDIAEVLLDIAQPKKFIPGIYHYCNIPAITRYDLAKKISGTASKFFELKIKNIYPITTDQYPVLAKRPKNSVLNSSLFEKTFNIALKPWQVNLEKSLNNLKELSRCKINPG